MVFFSVPYISGLLSRFSTLYRPTKIMKAFSVVFMSVLLFISVSFTSGQNDISGRELKKKSKKAPAAPAPAAPSKKSVKKVKKPKAPKVSKAAKAPKPPKASKAPKI